MRKSIFLVVALVMSLQAYSQGGSRFKSKLYESFKNTEEAQALPEEYQDLIYKGIICHMCDSLIQAGDVLQLNLFWKQPILDRSISVAKAIAKAIEEEEIQKAEEAKKLAVKKKEIFDEFVNKVDSAKQLTEQQQQ